MSLAGAEALGAKALGMKQSLLKSRVLQALVPSQQSQSAQTQMFLSQAFLAQGQSGQSPSSKGLVLMYLSQAWQALDLRERLLYPLMRTSVLLVFLALDPLARLQSRARQMFLSLESKELVKSAQYRLQALQTFLSQVFQRQER